MKGMKEPRKKSINLQKNFYGFGCKNSATSRIADAVLSKKHHHSYYSNQFKLCSTNIMFLRHNTKWQAPYFLNIS